MISVGDNGDLVIVTRLQTGEDWLLRVRSLIRLVQCVDESLMSKDDIYNALEVVADMLPDEDSAIRMFKALKVDRNK